MTGKVTAVIIVECYLYTRSVMCLSVFSREEVAGIVFY